MKRFVLMITALIMLFSLAGCTGSREVEDGVVIENNGTGGIYVENAENLQTLKIGFTEAGLGRNWLIRISKNFVKKYPQYKVVLDGDPQLADSLQTKLETGKNLSDIMMPLNSAWETYASRGWLEPLDDVYAMKPDGDDGKTNAEKIDESYRAYANFKSAEGQHYYIMPWNDTVTGIVYNVKMFRENGWSIPETTDELETLCQKILAEGNGIKPFAYPGKLGGYFDYIGSAWWLQSSGVDGVKEFFNFESPEVYNLTKHPAKGKYEALNEFSRFFAIDKGYGIAGSMSKDHITAQMDFMNGKAAMIVNANWMECEMAASAPEGFEMGMMRVPYLATAKKDENGNYIKVNYSTAPDYIIIPKSTSNKEGAKLFLNFMNSDEMLMLYTAETGSPRPFDYEPLKIEGLSSFVKDILTLREESERMFDYSRSPLWVNGHTQKYIGSQPYSSLVRKETDARKFCNTEYVEADENWASWVADSM